MNSEDNINLVQITENSEISEQIAIVENHEYGNSSVKYNEVAAKRTKWQTGQQQRHMAVVKDVNNIVSGSIKTSNETAKNVNKKNVGPEVKISNGNIRERSRNTLVIKGKQRGTSSEEIYSQLKSNIDPVGLSIDIVSVKKGAQGVSVQCRDLMSLNKLKRGIEEKNNGEWEVTMKKKINPKLIIKDVKNEDIEGNNEQIEESIIKQNKLDRKGDKSFEFKVVRRIEMKKEPKRVALVNLIVTVDPKTRDFILNKGVLSVGWKICKVKDSLHIKRCYKCCDYYHLARDCKSVAIVCATCAGSRESNLCTNTENEKCANCIRQNKLNKLGYNINHSAKSPECPYYQKVVKNLKINIKYKVDDDEQL